MVAPATQTSSSPSTVSQPRVDPPLTRGDLRRFKRDGFLHMPGFVSPDDLIELRDRLESLFDRFDELPSEYARDLNESPREPGQPPRNPEIEKCTLLDETLGNSAYVRKVQAAASQLLGGDADLGHDHSIRKPPAIGTGTAWHQDGAYDQARHVFNRLSFWLPLQPVSAEQGCLQFLPGTHKAGLQNHYSVTGDPKGHTLTTDVPADVQPAAVPMQLGDLVVHHPACLHCAGPNSTPNPRLAWVLIFQRMKKRPNAIMRRLRLA